MTEAERTRVAWQRLERWLADHLPAALDNLRPPIDDARSMELDTVFGMRFPDAFRVLLTLHDGEEQSWPAGVFPDGHWFLPSAQSEELWRQLVSIARELGEHEDAFDSWKAQIEDGVIFVRGPVKANVGSPKWIPFSDLEGQVQRFIDFDPAPGGEPGQVIEVDPEGCTYQVIAPSLVDFLEAYVSALEDGAYAVVDGSIVSPDEGVTDPTGWGMPEYLQRTTFEESRQRSGSTAAEQGASASDDDFTFEGSMGLLMGGPETIFTLQTPDGIERTFLAKADLTKGYRKIRIRQDARVRARRYTSDIPSAFVDAGTEPPEFVAIEYSMLRGG